MLLFTTLVFTIHIISSTAETVSNKHCSDLQCSSDEDAQSICVQVIEPKQGPAYVPLNVCAMKEFKCKLGDRVKMNIVEMSMCIRMTPPMNKRRAEPIEESDINKKALHKELGEPDPEPACPENCHVPHDMVCARCTHGIYRTFLSACHMRMYQCQSNEKLELVARRACYGSAPYVGGTTANPPKQRNVKLRSGVKRGKTRFQHLWLRDDDFTIPTEEIDTPKPTVHVTWPTRHRRTPTTKPRPITTTTSEKTTSERTSTTMKATTPTQSQSSSKVSLGDAEDDDINEDVTRIDVDICSNDEDQDTIVNVPDQCTNSTENAVRSQDYMKVDLHPDVIEDGSPVWMVFNKGVKITSSIRADAGLVVGCVAYAGLDYSGTVIVRNKNDNDFLGLVFGYRSNRQFYLVTWKATSAKYWQGWPSVVKADAGLHIKLVNSSTGPSAYLRNALYSTKSVKDQVTLLWQDPKKQGWKHLIMYHWQLIHRPQIGLIRLKVFRTQGQELIVDSGNIYDKTIKGGRIGVYAFSQESIEWLKMDFKCNDKIPSNLMSELPPDLQKIKGLVEDTAHKWTNESSNVGDPNFF